MGSAKQQSAISKIMSLLQEWDKGSKVVRHKILQDFVAQNQNKTGPELEQEFAQAASLFLTRLTAWLRLTYMIGTSLNEQLRAVSIFLSASSGHKFMAEFLEVGGVLTLLEIIGLKQAKEEDKLEALKNLIHISNVLMLAQGNPKFEGQVYKGLIALLPCSSPKAQQMAAQSLRVVQPIVKTANPNIVEPLLNLLKTLHLEVQFEAIEMIKELMEYDVSQSILKQLVTKLRPAKEDTIKRPEILEDPEIPKINAPLPVFVQQAAAAKTIGILSRESNEIAEKLIQLRVTHNLLYSMGNMDYADSQRQSSISLEYLCRTFPIVDEHVREAMGENLYDMFMSNPEALYMTMNHVQADVLVSNKVNIPKLVETVD